MKIVRLNKQDLQDWRSGAVYLVGADGRLREELPVELSRAVDTLTRSARSQRKTLEQSVTITRAGGHKRTAKLMVVVTRTGLGSGDLASTATVDGCRIVTGKDVVCARKLQEHGECQLRMPNGVILKVVRDPNLKRPSFAESERTSPPPELCPCAAWGNPHPGRHYITCPHNRSAPPHEQAVTEHIAEAEARALPTEAFASLASRGMPTAATAVLAAKVSPTAAVVQAPELDPPEACRNGCLDWATPKGHPIPAGQHHPTCIFARPWAIKTAKETPRWLVDITTGERVRRATDAEIGQASVIAERTGAPILHIDERPYAVILETELGESSVDPIIAAHPAKPATVIAPLPAPEPGVITGPDPSTAGLAAAAVAQVVS